MTKRIALGFIDGIAAAFVTLYGYTGLTKLFLQAQFEGAMRHSPMIAKIAPVLSFSIPLMELSVCVLLIIPRARFAGLICATLLMLAFTLYAIYILASAGPPPCSCGGIIQLLGWKAHLIVNSCFVTAGMISILLFIKFKKFIAINRTSRTPEKHSRQTIHHF